MGRRQPREHRRGPHPAWRSPPVEAGRATLTAAGFFDAAGRALQDDARTPLDASARGFRSAWAAYRPDGGRRFSLHDDLAGVRAGPVSYTVVGWYSSLSDDPLHAAGDAQARLEWLKDARWTAPGIGSGALLDGAEFINPRLLVPGTIPGIGTPPTGGPPIEVPPVVLQPPGGRPINPVLPGVGRPGTDVRIGPDIIGRIDRVPRPTRPVEVAPARPIAEVAPTLRGALDANLSRLATASDGLQGLFRASGASEQEIAAMPPTASLTPEVVERLYLVPGMSWVQELSERVGSVPDRIYCHGSVYDLPVGNVGGVFDAAAPIALQSRPAWSLGDSVGECLARVLEPDGDVRWVTHANASLRLGSVQQLGELPRIQQYLHEQGFRTETTGFDEQRVPDRAPDPKLRVATEIDARSVATMLQRAGLPEEIGRAAIALRDNADTRETGVRMVSAVVEVAQGGGRSAGVLGRGARVSADQRRLFESAAPRLTVQSPGALRSNAERFLRALEGRGGWRPPRTSRTIKVPRPRVWRAHAPQICVMGLQRSLRHFEDGRFDADKEGRLVCRLTGQTANYLALNGDASLTATELWSEPSEVQRLPATAQELVREAVLLDPSSAPSAAAAAGRQRARNANPEAAFRFESTFWWNTAWSPQAAAEVSRATGYAGTLPSLIGVRPWRRAWNPLFLEYDVSFLPTTGPGTAGFTLGEVEHLPTSTLRFGAPLRFQGRALLTPVAARTLASGLLRAARDAASMEPDQEEALEAASEAAAALDVLTASIEGLDRRIREAGGDLRAGALRVERLRVVDSFGQTQTLNPGAPVVDSDDLIAVSQGVNAWLLPPRLTKRARMDFRFVQAGAPERDADASSGPVCGWLMLDHIEHAVEVFDAKGTSLGQLSTVNGRAAWEPAPGADAAWGGQVAAVGPDGQPVNDALRRFVGGVLDADWRVTDRTGVTESSVSALVRLLDTVRQTVDRAGESADQLAQLADRPIAVCRATVRLDVFDEGEVVGGARPSRALPAGLEVRLGSLAQPDDGLVAWCDRDAHVPPSAAHQRARQRSCQREEGRPRGRSERAHERDRASVRVGGRDGVAADDGGRGAVAAPRGRLGRPRDDGRAPAQEAPPRAGVDGRGDAQDGADAARWARGDRPRERRDAHAVGRALSVALVAPRGRTRDAEELGGRPV